MFTNLIIKEGSVGGGLMSNMYCKEGLMMGRLVVVGGGWLYFATK